MLPGASSETVFVTAHYDRSRGPGEGAIDNWSGSALLPSLFESLRGERRHYTFVFMAFSDEERGLIGSREYVQGLSGAQRGKTVAAVNIDCIGLRGPRAS